MLGIIFIIQIVFVVLIIFGMILILMSINHLTHNDDSTAQDITDSLRTHLDDNDKVIPDESVFHRFLARDSQTPSDKDLPGKSPSKP